MDLFSTFIISVTEGLTEFLPISSTGHMIVVSELMNLEQSDKLKALEIMIQFFAILAILFIYKNKISFKEKNLWLKTIVAFLPLGIVGFIFADLIKSLFDIKIVAIMFIVGGVALLFAEKIYKNNKREEITKIEDINFIDSFKIGLFQVLSLIPGTSRSGATIFGGMFLGINRELSSEFSFLLAVPVTFSVFAYDLFKHWQVFSIDDFKILAFASLISFVTAYISVKALLKFLEKFTFFSFGVYRILFGLILLLFFI